LLVLLWIGLLWIVMAGIALGGKTGQPGTQPLETRAKKIGAEGQVEAQVHRAPGAAKGTVPGIAWSPALVLAFSLAIDLARVIAVVVVRRQGEQEALLVAPPLPLLAALQLGGQPHQLLDREQTITALHQGLEPLLQLQAAAGTDGAEALWIGLGGQMETGLLHRVQQALAEHLQIKGQLAIKLWSERQDQLTLQLQLALGLRQGAAVGVQWGR
jgi:hypothetical protein